MKKLVAVLGLLLISFTAFADAFPTVDMRPVMVAKDQIKGVIMFTPEQREAHRIVIKNGIVYDNQGQVVPDTENKKDDYANYVMDPSGNFYLFDETATPLIRHSSIFDQGPVSGAGNLKIVKGKIVYLDSDSGHYPSMPLFPQVLEQLKAMGVDTTGFQAENYKQ